MNNPPPAAILVPATAASSLQLASVQLRVSDLARSVDFYTHQLGFVLIAPATAGHAALATGAGALAILELTEDRTAAQAPADAAGLFHAALLLPSRPALGRWLRHAVEAKVQFDGFSDHGVSEAIYLADPDGNGLEFYADRPRAQWPLQRGELQMITAPLNVADLLGAAAPSDASPLRGAHWGHLHLRVSDLDRAENFYTSALGVALTQRFGASARFLATDGYHHHLGLNNWGGIGRPQPPGALGLISATFSAGAISSPQSRRDPDGIALRLQPLTSSP